MSNRRDWLAVLADRRRHRLIVIAIVYWAEPAKSLPGFFPGHERARTTTT